MVVSFSSGDFDVVLLNISREEVVLNAVLDATFNGDAGISTLFSCTVVGLGRRVDCDGLVWIVFLFNTILLTGVANLLDNG